MDCVITCTVLSIVISYENDNRKSLQSTTCTYCNASPHVTQYITGLLYKCTCTFETSSVCVSFTVVAKVVSALEELQNNTCDKLLAFNIPVFNSHV